MPRHNGAQDRTMRIGEAASYLGVSVETLRRWDRDGSLIPRRNRTGARFYTATQLDEYAGGSGRTPATRPNGRPSAPTHSSADPSVLHAACRLAGRLTTEDYRVSREEVFRWPGDLGDRCYRVCVRRVRERLVPGITLEELAPVVSQTVGAFVSIARHNRFLQQDEAEGIVSDDTDYLPYPDEAGGCIS
jgi:excisionase family DNA binding protein